jgi:hypothetical protein
VQCIPRTAIPENRCHAHKLAHAEQDIQQQIDPTRKLPAELPHAGGAQRWTLKIRLTKLRHHQEPEHRTENCMQIDAWQMLRAGPGIPQQARGSHRTEQQRKPRAAGDRGARA